MRQRVRKPIDLRIDVSSVTGLDGPLHTAASIFMPDLDRLASSPMVAFGFPGAGYSRRYYSFDLPGASLGGQAGHHVTEHGWIFVACDHLGVGDSSIPDMALTTFETVVAANGATVDHVLALLGAGDVAPDVPALADPVCLGIGHSMGGCLTVKLQGTAPRFDGVAVLGYSAIHSVVPRRDAPPLTFDGDGFDENRDNTLRWAFHWDDVPDEIARSDVAGFPVRDGHLPEWASATLPGCVVSMPTRGVIAAEAAEIRTPVFVGAGERDIVPDIHAEASAYSKARDVTLFEQPLMAHMHNFSSHRTRLWDRIGAWGDAVARTR